MNLSEMSIMPPDSLMFGNQKDVRMQMPSRIRPYTGPEDL